MKLSGGFTDAIGKEGAVGCDIHFFVERRNGDGTWHTADAWEPDEYEPNRIRVPYEKSFCHDRSYSLFSILANVRNGYGFAGVDTGDGFLPIAEPRGMPNDASPEVAAEAESWDGDGHSHSYFTVAELLAFDWTQMTTRRGVLDLAEYVQWNRWRRKYGEQPESWCGDITGRSIVVVDDGPPVVARLKPLIQNMDARTPEQINAAAREMGVGYTNVRCAWTVPYYMTCEHFWSRTIPRLLRLGKPEEVRAVFWFDN